MVEVLVKVPAVATTVTNPVSASPRVEVGVVEELPPPQLERPTINKRENAAAHI
jgi:hypothetical protein